MAEPFTPLVELGVVPSEVRRLRTETRRFIDVSGYPARREYKGVVNSRFMAFDTLNSGIASIMATRGDFAMETIVNPQILLQNFINTVTGQQISTADHIWTASIEYPVGTVTQIKFNGSATGVAVAGTPWLYSDPLVGLTIPRGAFFKLQLCQRSTEGIFIGGTTAGYGVLGDQQTIGSNVTDQTLNPSWTGTAGGNGVGAIVLSMTRRPTLLAWGDSRWQGVGNTSNSVAYPGEIGPIFGPKMGFINFSRGSLKAADAANIANFPYIGELFQYTSHDATNLGTNDLSGSAVTGAQAIAYRTTIQGYAPTKTWLHATMMPKTTSSDLWATITNQTIDTNNANVVIANDSIRAKLQGPCTVLEFADAFESSRNSGKLKAPPMTDVAITADGNHCNNKGYALGQLTVYASLISGAAA